MSVWLQSVTVLVLHTVLQGLGHLHWVCDYIRCDIIVKLDTILFYIFIVEK